ncbi:conserved hypothetical protein [Brucella sp. 83/13]|nr:conserved hypothetical protein [Brucella sp. 83/13]
MIVIACLRVSHREKSRFPGVIDDFVAFRIQQSRFNQSQHYPRKFPCRNYQLCCATTTAQRL